MCKDCVRYEVEEIVSLGPQWWNESCAKSCPDENIPRARIAAPRKDRGKSGPEERLPRALWLPPPSLLKILEGGGCSRAYFSAIFRVPGLLNSIIIRSPGIVDFCRLFRVSDVRGPRT